ncbi:MAG: hypothetical protein JSW68_09295, partial [Burkholderiales bacterium]
IGRFGGPLDSCKGLWEEFGDARVIDTPISEGAVVGAAVGAALTGKRPIVDIMFLEFLPMVLQQLGCDAGAMHYYSDGAARVPLVVRAKFGVGPFHGHPYDHHPWAAYTPGVKVAIPFARSLEAMVIPDQDAIVAAARRSVAHRAAARAVDR